MFLLAAIVATAATILAVTAANAMHALLYLIVSLLAVAVVMVTLGAPFAAALEVIVYAGAILVLMVFVVMMLNVGRDAARHERRLLTPAAWVLPGLLSAVLLGQLVYGVATGGLGPASDAVVLPQAVGMRLFTVYLLAVELGGMLLLAALIGAYHLSRAARRRDADMPAQEGE